MQDCWLELFPKAEKVHNNEPLHLFLLVFITMTLVISLMEHFRTTTESFYVCPGQWRNLQALKRFGFAMDRARAGPGDLALFFPAFPQPGINLPEGGVYSNE